MLYGTLYGRMGRDAELRYTPGGKEVASFSVACDEGYGDHKETNWWDVVAWGSQAKFIAEYGGKGREVIIAGRMRKRKYEARDGSSREATEMVAQDLKLVGGRREADDQQPQQQPHRPPAGRNEPLVRQQPAQTIMDMGLDDIPF